jgi:hypothetical protein
MEHTDGDDETLAPPTKRQKAADRLQALRVEATALVEELAADESYIGKNRIISFCTCGRLAGLYYDSS